VRACPDRSEFLARPTGRWIAGRTWLYFHRDEALVGFVLWGKPAPADLEQLALVLAVELEGPPHVSLVDVRAVSWVDPRGFLVLERYVRKHREALSRAVTRLALVRPGGMLGAVTAGFFGVATPPYPVEVFEEREPALAWLGVDDRPAALAELAQAEAECGGTPELLRDLRAWLPEHLEQAELGAAARALKLSERTLQRRLAESSATFQEEVSRARVEVAKRLLRDTDAKLTAIALDVGCASLPSFSALFRRATGHAPSAWRAKAKAGQEG
jgi:AraC-like DNA-binding protein